MLRQLHLSMLSQLHLSMFSQLHLLMLMLTNHCLMFLIIQCVSSFIEGGSVVVLVLCCSCGLLHYACVFLGCCFAICVWLVSGLLCGAFYVCIAYCSWLHHGLALVDLHAAEACWAHNLLMDCNHHLLPMWVHWCRTVMRLRVVCRVCVWVPWGALGAGWMWVVRWRPGGMLVCCGGLWEQCSINIITKYVQVMWL